MDLWDEGAEPIELEPLAGRECFGGLDLASTSDIASFCLVFPPSGKTETYLGKDDFTHLRDDGEKWRALWWNWIPRDGAKKRAVRDRAPYLDWEKTQQIILTDGNVTDYDVIREDILKACETFTVREIAYDTWNATQIVTQLGGEGLTMVPMRQGFMTFNAPAKELERWVLGRTFQHGGNPVARWCASNVMLETDAAGNIKPSKAVSTEKIDAVVSLIMAIWRAVLARDESSVYAEHGIRFI
jgi:phage terminase large subunit-like protein